MQGYTSDRNRASGRDILIGLSALQAPVGLFGCLIMFMAGAPSEPCQQPNGAGCGTSPEWALLTGVITLLGSVAAVLSAWWIWRRGTQLWLPVVVLAIPPAFVAVVLGARGFL